MNYNFGIQDLRNLCGFVEDGSHTTVVVEQDDATRDWICRVGKKDYYGKSFGEAVDNALKGQGLR